jgi:hypothetical protein
MNKDFTLHPEALELKQLGFDEPCIAWYAENKELQIAPDTYKKWSFKACNNSNIISVFNSDCITAPTYSQAFRWFREKHNYHVIIDFNQSKNNKWYYGIIQIDHNISVSPDVEFETYEEAELAALKELIKTIKDRT